MNTTNFNQNELLNVTRSVKFNDVVPTQLRLNSYYYKIYCIGFNSLVASVIPLISLFYLNISTILGEKVSNFKTDTYTVFQKQAN